MTSWSKDLISGMGNASNCNFLLSSRRSKQNLKDVVESGLRTRTTGFAYSEKDGSTIPRACIFWLIAFSFCATWGEYRLALDLMGSLSEVLIEIMQLGKRPTGSVSIVMKSLFTSRRIILSLSWIVGSK